MHGYICDPNVALVIDCDAVWHVKETCSPAGQNVTGFRAQGDNGVRQNGTFLYVLVMVRLVEWAEQNRTRIVIRQTFTNLTHWLTVIGFGIGVIQCYITI